MLPRAGYAVVVRVAAVIVGVTAVTVGRLDWPTDVLTDGWNEADPPQATTTSAVRSNRHGRVGSGRHE
jgi:hypothetical protein